MRVEKPEFSGADDLIPYAVYCSDCPFATGALDCMSGETPCPTNMESYLAACKLAEEAGL